MYYEAFSGQCRVGGHITAVSSCLIIFVPTSFFASWVQVTIVALQQIFSRFGKVDKIVMFDKGSGSQALVQMADVHMAMSAHGAADMQVHSFWL